MQVEGWLNIENLLEIVDCEVSLGLICNYLSQVCKIGFHLSTLKHVYSLINGTDKCNKQFIVVRKRQVIDKISDVFLRLDHFNLLDVIIF